MKTVIIIQARMGSSRLPGKSLMDIHGKPLIWHVVERAGRSTEVTEIIIATTTDPKDDAIAEAFKHSNTKVFRGSVDDVLDRYYQAAKSVHADIVVRITGDSPLVDPYLIDEAIKIFKQGNYDYVSNGQQPWMDGFDVEVISFKALEEAWNNAKLASEREHVTPHIRNNEKFRKYYLQNDPRLDGIHCSVDQENDLELIREIYQRMFAQGRDHRFTYKDVIALFEKEPSLLLINKGNVVNEGYAKSLREDKKVK